MELFTEGTLSGTTMRVWTGWRDPSPPSRRRWPAPTLEIRPWRNMRRLTFWSPCNTYFYFVKMLIRTLIYIFASNRFSLAYRWRRDISFAASSTDWLFSISPPSIPSSFFLFNRLCRVICWRLISNWLGLKLYKYEELNLSYINICTLWYYTYIV